MANLKQWILDAAAGEPIEAVVIGKIDHYDRPEPAGQRAGVVLSWKDAAPMLDYEFDGGYGTPECNPVVAWTPTVIISVSQYDGSTSPFTIPRHPTAHDPDMPGGG